MKQIQVHFGSPVGKIKPMNAVNNGPLEAGSDQSKGNFNTYRAARIPYARLHDTAIGNDYGGPHVVDITKIFPDFDADPEKPESYDFVITDALIKTINDAGTEVFYRLGESIEHTPVKYCVNPPKDFRKWAIVCEHVIRHYTEGWANGFTYRMTYWEIWNEPNLMPSDSPTWRGTEEQFYDLFEITAKHLKSCFPHLKIGGPAVARGREWGEAFLAEMKKRGTPLDFYSWHRYTCDPANLLERVAYTRKSLDDAGYPETESILNEWSYVKGWTTDWIYSLHTMGNIKGASYVTAIMTSCQYTALDMLMYYDTRPCCAMNGMFDFYDLSPRKTYYAVYSFSDLADLGTAVKVKCAKDFYAAAATDENGNGGVLLTYYNDNDRAPKKEVTVDLKGIAKPSTVEVYRTDADKNLEKLFAVRIEPKTASLTIPMNLFDVFYLKVIAEK